MGDFDPFAPQPNQQNQQEVAGEEKKVDALIGDPLFQKALEHGESFMPRVETQQNQQQQQQQDDGNWEVRAKFYQSEADKLKAQLEQTQSETEALAALKEELESNPELAQHLYSYYENGAPTQNQQQPPQQQQQQPLTPPEEFSPYEIANPASPSGQYFQGMLKNILQESLKPELQRIQQYVDSRVGTVNQQLEQQTKLQKLRAELNQVPEQEFNEFVQWSTSKKTSPQDLYKLYLISTGKMQPQQAQQQQQPSVVPNLTSYSSPPQDENPAKRMIDAIISTGNQSLF